jgi:hypothetical protein
MFGLSKKDRKPSCPIPEERREWLEYAFDWLVKAFGEDPIRQRQVLTPQYSDFPIRYNGDPQTGRETIDIIARQMEIDPAEIELLFYEVCRIEFMPNGKLNRTRFSFFLSCPDPEKKPHFCKAVRSKLALSYHFQTQPIYMLQIHRHFLFQRFFPTVRSLIVFQELLIGSAQVRKCL